MIKKAPSKNTKTPKEVNAQTKKTPIKSEDTSVKTETSKKLTFWPAGTTREDKVS